ncbi:hypothetical protein ES708_15384 [subsurface metagenome]
MIRKILLAIVLIFLITGIGFASQDEIAFKNEPDGFRGLKWGDAPTEDMVCFGKSLCFQSTYERKGDKLGIGSATFDEIWYKFNYYSCQFYEAGSSFIGTDNYNILKVIFEGRFGEPTKTYEKYSFYTLQWTGKKTEIKLCYNFERYEGFIVIKSMKIHPESPEDNKQKEVEKAEEDF